MRLTGESISQAISTAPGLPRTQNRWWAMLAGMAVCVEQSRMMIRQRPGWLSFWPGFLENGRLGIDRPVCIAATAAGLVEIADARWRVFL